MQLETPRIKPTVKSNSIQHEYQTITNLNFTGKGAQTIDCQNLFQLFRGIYQ